MATKITRDVLESYLRCTYKGHLKVAGEQGHLSDYAVLQGEARHRIRRAAADKLIERHKGGAILRDVTLTRSVLKQGASLLLDAIVDDPPMSPRFDALQREVGPSRLGDFHYAPVVFDEAERPRRQHKELLELYGVILGDLQGKQPSSGILLHGQSCAARRIHLNSSVQKAQRILREIKDLQGAGTPPPLLLNDHCPLCEFRTRCHAVAAAADDLSLLGGPERKGDRKVPPQGDLYGDAAVLHVPPTEEEEAGETAEPATSPRLAGPGHSGPEDLCVRHAAPAHRCHPHLP